MKDDGGTAFPSHGSMGEVAQEGMTLRDYFAAKAEGPDGDATAEFVAKCLGWPVPRLDPSATRDWFMWWRAAESEWKYAQADAMLKARK